MAYEFVDEPQGRYEFVDEPTANTTTLQDIAQHGKNALGGAIRGAGSIGATLLTPIDALARSLNDGKPININGYDIAGQDRRTAMDAGLTSAGADPESWMYKGFKLGGEVVGTAGAGGAVANAVAKLAPSAAAAAPAFIQAMRTGGLSTGAKAAPGVAGWAANMAPRIAGGAVAGGVTAGLVNPEDAGTGVLIGGALPPGVQLAKVLGAGTKNAVAGLTKHTLGTTTGTGAESLGTAYRAGKQGGTAFLDNLRGKVPFTDVLDDAKVALSKMRIDRSNQYKQGMAGVSADKTVIDFTPIDSAVSSLKSMGNYKGQVSFSGCL